MRAAANARILALVDPALNTMQTAIEDPDPKVRAVAVAAATDILDRAGLSATQKLDVTAEVTSKDEFAAYLMGAREAFDAEREKDEA